MRNRSEAEEAVQDAYLKAFAGMTDFAGASSLSTWLTRIVINQTLERKRTAERRERLLRKRSVTDLDDYREKFMAGSETQRSPEAEMMRRQIAKLYLERAIANLPETFRPVFVLREIEGLGVEETADVLQIPKETVKLASFVRADVYSGISIQVFARFCTTRFPSRDGIARRLLSACWRDFYLCL